LQEEGEARRRQKRVHEGDKEVRHDSKIDNFLPSTFVVDGIEYYSAENYFQCCKCTIRTGGGRSGKGEEGG
jgi:predicted NAD-dependent protein-ADP-ribosyltransferase YbiA (DUF1768 family)